MSTNAAEERWGIVGGGLLGMTLAHRLAREGRQVTLFEAAPHLGGLASAWTIGDVVWDRHYHVTLLSDTALRGLLAELGLEGEMEWRQTRTGFYTGGRLYSMSNAVEFLRFPPLGPIDKLRLAFTILYASRLRDWKRLEQVPVEDWLRRWSGGRTFEKIWLPLLKAKLGENYRNTAATFIWATIARMYAARRSGLKKEMFGHVRGGYARVLERFASALKSEGVALRPGHAAVRIEPGGGAVRVHFASQPSEVFDQVILTAPAPAAARLCPALESHERQRLESVRYQGIVCASLVTGRPLAGYYVTNITDSAPFTAVIEMSALVDRSQFGGDCLIYLPKYVSPEDPAFERSDEEIERTFLDALERMYPGFRRQDVKAFRISRVRHVVPLPTLGYSDRLPSMTTSIPGLHIVNSAHIVNGTLNANETVQLAERAAVHLMSLPARQCQTV